MKKFAINDRIKLLMDSLNLNQNQFSKRIGTSSSRVSNIITKRNKPDSDLLAMICFSIKKVNARWLLTGEGKMYDQEEIQSTDYNIFKEPEPSYYKKEELINYITVLNKISELENKINKLTG